MGVQDTCHVEDFLRGQLNFLMNDDLLDYYRHTWKNLGDLSLTYQVYCNEDWFETNNHITFYLQKAGNFLEDDFLHSFDTKEYELPSIHYGFLKENGIPTCYIYGIQNIHSNAKDKEILQEIQPIRKSLRNPYMSADFILAMSFFFDFLNEINQTNIEYDDDNLSFLKDVLDLTYTLVNNYSIMPELFKTEESYIIRWIPSFYSSNVINHCRKYYIQCPDNLVTFNKQPLLKENQVIILISLLMNALIKYSINKNEIKGFPYVSNIVFKLFTGEKLRHEQNRYSNSIENISKQISVFSLNELKYDYVMFIDENLDLDIKIKEEDNYKSIEEANDDELKNIRKIYDLFTHYDIDNTIYEKIRLDNKDFIKFNNIEHHN